MAKQRNYSTEFKRQVVLEYLAGETPYGLSKRHNVSRNVIRLRLALGSEKHAAREENRIVLKINRLGEITPGFFDVNLDIIITERKSKPIG